MCDQTQIPYGDGDVVWVKLSSTWWPGEVLAPDRVPPDVLASFRKPPIAIVKFFREETFEFVRNLNSIYKYNCSRKHEFIKKGLDQWRAKHAHMGLFPAYVREAEERTHGDPTILSNEEFQPDQRVDYNTIFGTPTAKGSPQKVKSKVTVSGPEERTPRITHPRIIQKYLKGTSDYKMHIMVQERDREEQGEGAQSPALCGMDGEGEDTPPPPRTPAPSTPSSGPLTCPVCSFSCTRISVMVLHSKWHSASFVPYTPPKRPPVRPTHSTPAARKHNVKQRGRPKKIDIIPSPSLPKSSKPSPSPKRKAKEKKVDKVKTEIDIKNSLLADWNENSDDDSMDLLTSLQLTENQNIAESRQEGSDANDSQSPEPIEAEDDKGRVTPDSPKYSQNDDTQAKPESPSKCNEPKKVSCFDFDDEEDLPIESIGRKIPRLSSKSDDVQRKPIDFLDSSKIEKRDISQEQSLESNETEPGNIDADIDNLLQETALPELPALPTEVKFQEKTSPPKNIEKDVSYDKNSSKPQQKSIFKTKTFFRSRHSRSQDAIEKYVADNTSLDKPLTYMEEPSDSDTPPVVQAPEVVPPLALSPPPQAKAPKFAPKIQLKKMKAAFSDQIKTPKPQETTPREEPSELPIDTSVCITAHHRWDDESVLSLLKYSSVDQHSRTINDLLGTMEDIQNASHQACIGSDQATEQECSMAMETHTSVAEEHVPVETVEPELEQNLVEMNAISTPVCDYSSPKLSVPKVECETISETKAIECLPEAEMTIAEPTLELSMAESVPDLPTVKSVPELTTTESVPELTIAESVPEFTISECVPELSTEESVPKLSIVESVPELSTVESVSKFTIAESVSELSTEETVPELSTEESIPVLSTGDSVPVLSTGESVPELSAGESFPESSTGESNSESTTAEPISELIEESDSHQVVEKTDQPSESAPVEMTSIEDGNLPSKIDSQPMNTSQEVIQDDLPQIEPINSNNIPIPEEEQALSPPALALSSEYLESDNANCVIDSKLTNHESEPTESDLQIAETLINLPTSGAHTTIDYQPRECAPVESSSESKMTENDKNFSAARSLVQMSETLQSEQVAGGPQEEEQATAVTTFSMEDNLEPVFTDESEKSEIATNINVRDQPMQQQATSPAVISPTKLSPIIEPKKLISKVTPLKEDSMQNSKLFQILDEPNKNKPKPAVQILQSKPTSQGREKILNFQVGGVGAGAHKPRVIIRKGHKGATGPWDTGNVQTFTIQQAGGAALKQKLLSKPSNTIITSTGKLIQTVDSKEEEGLFDINSMPIVLSEEILTPENIDKMPIVMTDTPVTSAPAQITPVMTETVAIKKDKIKASPGLYSEKTGPPIKKYGLDSKSNVIMKPSVSPNILSKSPKVKTMKHLLVVDKNTGEQKLITSEGLKDVQNPQTVTKIMKTSPSALSQQQKGEKFIILPPGPAKVTTEHAKISPTVTKISPTASKVLPPAAKRTQKIIVNPQTGKSQIIIGEAIRPESVPSLGQNKPKTATAKIIQNRSNMESSSGNTIMILTNSQGIQSKIVLTPEHQRLLFPKKGAQIAVTSQAIVTSRGAPPSASSPAVQRAMASLTPFQPIITSRGHNANPISGNALITSTGQLIPAHSQQSLKIISKQKGNLTPTSRMISSGTRTILTGKPNQTILTSKGQLITTQSSPITSQSRLQSEVNKIITSSSHPHEAHTKVSSQHQPQKIMGKPKQGLLRVSPKPEKILTPVAPSTVFIKSGGKLLNADTASILHGKKPGTVMHLTAAQFERLQKTGQIIQQPSLTQIVSPSKMKGSPGKVQTQKFILQKYANTKQTPQTIMERKPEALGMGTAPKHKVLSPGPAPKNMPSLVQTGALHGPTPPKKQKLRELLTVKSESSAKKRESVYPSPSIKATTDQYKITEQQVMELGNLDELIPATTISTCKGEVRTNDTVHMAKPAVEPALAQVQQSVLENLVQKEPAVLHETGVVMKTEEIPPAQPSGIGDGQLLAVPGENFGGPPNSFYLCMEENGTLTPINNQPLVLENNQLVPMVIPPVLPEQQVIINAGDQQILVDQQTLLSLLGGERLVTTGDNQLLLQGDVRQLLAALTPQTTPNQDILAAALADTDVFQPEAMVPEGLSVVTGNPEGMLVEMDNIGTDFQNLNAVVSVHSNVSETSTTLKQPIMSPVELPSKTRVLEDGSQGVITSTVACPETVPQNLEDSLAVIGVTPPSVPTSLDLPITVTDPRIAPKTTHPLSLSCGAIFPPSGLMSGAIISPSSGLDVYPTSLLQDIKTSASESFHPASLLSKSTESKIDRKRKRETVLEQKIADVPRKKSYSSFVSKKDDYNKAIKQPASSMPCLDDSSSDSFTEDNPQQLTEAIQTKTYSPISMPLLTEDTVEETVRVPSPPTVVNEMVDSHNLTTSKESLQAEQEVTEIQNEVKSMPVLLDSDDFVSQEEDAPRKLESDMPSLEIIEESNKCVINTEGISMPMLDSSVTDEPEESQSCKETNVLISSQDSPSQGLPELPSSEPPADEIIPTDAQINTNEYHENECLESSFPEDQVHPEAITENGENDVKTDQSEISPQNVGGINDADVENDMVPPYSCEISDLPDENDVSQNTPVDLSERCRSEDLDAELDIAPSSVPGETCESPLASSPQPVDVGPEPNCLPMPLPCAEPEGNSLDHFNEDYNEIDQQPAEPASEDPIPLVGENAEDSQHFSDSSSDASTEIPIQPSISVSHHLVQNLPLINHSEDKNGDTIKRPADEDELNDDFKSPTKRFRLDAER